MIFSTLAYAQESAPQGPSTLEQFLPFVFIFAIFYFFIIRPQSKRQQQHSEYLSQLKRGEEVITNSGIYGTVEGITDRFVTLEVAEDVRIRVLKTHIAGSATSTESATNGQAAGQKV